MRRPTLMLLILTTICATSVAGDVAKTTSYDLFERKIRPILLEKCISCHGPKAQKSGLRLDSRAAFLQGGANGPIVTRNEPENSTLIEVIGYHSDLKMPPNGKLSDASIADFKTWVEQGTPWPETIVTNTKTESAGLWALKPIENPPAPSVKLTSWSQTSIDTFILAKLEAMGLDPAPKADRRTLLRRWSYTLTGLPPTPEELQAFELDNSPNAEQKAVDRLLASPHYGERWARHWLDVARYADTKGYVFFEDAAFPWAYTYRDYVIRAFNTDLPYNRFLLEQLAADRLELGSDQRPLTALGFLTVGGRFMNNVQDIIDDRIDVTTRGILGLTVTCARCHDHKFDPIPTSDYYSLYGVFGSSVEPSVPPLFETPPESDGYRKFDVELRKREAALDAFVQEKYDALIRTSKSRAAEYLLAARQAKNKPKTDDFMLLADSNDINPLMINRWRSMLDRTRRSHDPVFAIWNTLADCDDATFAQKAPEALATLIKTGRPHNPVLVQSLQSTPPRTPTELATLYAKWLNKADAIISEANERARLNRLPRERSPIDGLDELAQVFQGPDSPSNLPRASIDNLSLVPDRPGQAILTSLTKSVETWRSTGPNAPPRAMSLVDLPQPIEPRIYLRGNPNTPGPTVSRHHLTMFGEPRPFVSGSGRLELAQAIVDPKNPLTARVLVNRVWMHHFGTPLVSTPSDFGSRSSPPSHPELLDHLASTFIHDGWSINQLHLRILLSATYAQSSESPLFSRKLDPENRFYSHMNRRRLDWESTRDFLLATSGRLDRTIGGPSVPGLIASKSGRRTLYGAIDRLNLPGIYRTFDFPDPNSSNPQRAETSVPPQALFFMNHPLLREASQSLRQRTDVAKATTHEDKLKRLFAIMFNRQPISRELTFLLGSLGTNPTPSDWDRLIQAIYLSNEFVFID